jgi:hypothetical protein
MMFRTAAADHAVHHAAGTAAQSADMAVAPIARRSELVQEAEAQRALAELFPHLQLQALRAIQELFPVARQQAGADIRVH